MANDVMLSARSVAMLLARIFGPSIWDDPHFGGGGPLAHVHPALTVRQALGGMSNGALLEAMMLNPQPLPPRERYALLLADATISEIVAVSNMGMLFGSDAGQRMQEVALRQLANFEEMCPRWPPWPKTWPPPPPPPWEREEMAATELFVVGARLAAAADVAQDERLQGALADAGSRLMEMGVGKLG